MVAALQLFAQQSPPHTSPPSSSPSNKQPASDFVISKILKDLLLYSYPNSIARLANSPGGLRLALPSIGITVAKGSISVDSTISTNVSSLQTPFNIKQRLMELIKSPSSVSKMSFRSTLFSDCVDDINSSPKHGELELDPIFSTNSRLLLLSQTLSFSSTSVSTYDKTDVSRALNALNDQLSLINKSRLNRSQLIALSESILRPIALIQGPPGTGKVCKFYLILIFSSNHYFLISSDENRMRFNLDFKRLQRR
jgi:hypothetical protein